MIQVIDLRKNFGNLEVLKGISLEIKKGELVSIIGSSGAGKTTLLQILGTLDKASSGELIINGKPIHNYNRKELAQFRNDEIGFIFQFHHLLPEFTALENIIMPGLIAKKNRRALEEKAEHLMELLKISHRKNHKPSELSGGEQQRVAVARALINDPSVVLADEPSGNLDTDNAEDLHQLFKHLQKELNQTFVIVTHNKDLAALSDRTIEIRDGQIVK